MTDQEFEKDSVISGLYNAIEKEKPSSEIDREILAGAYEMKTTKSGSPFSGGWKVPLSLAAVLVVGLAVVLRLGISPKQPMPEADDQVLPKMKQEQVLETESAPQSAMPDKARMSAPAPVVEMEDAAVSSEVREQKQMPMASDSARSPNTMRENPARKKASVADKDQPEAPAGISLMKEQAEPSEAVSEKMDAQDSEAATVGNGKLVPTEEMEQHLKTYGSMDQFMTPGYWEQEIVLLFMADRKDHARQQLKLFKEAFPDYNSADLESMLAE